MNKQNPHNNSQSGNFIYLITAIAALGGLLFGYDTGVISGALIFIEHTFTVSTWDKEIIVSSVVLGALFGAISSGQLVNTFGRRKMLITAAIGFIIGTLMSTFAPSPAWIILGRLIIGLAIGVSSYTAPMFISEMAPAKRRGALVLLNGVAITGGEAIAFLVDYTLIPTHSWRLMFATCLVPAILFLIGMLFLPATPRWMALKGYLEKARFTLRRIRNKENVNEEFDEILQSLENKESHWRALFTRKIRPILWIGLALGILQQFVGINTVIYYGPVIFKAAGFHSQAAGILATFGMGIVNTVMTIVAVFIVDYLGRRALLLGGTFAATISLIVIGLLFHLNIQASFAHWLMLFFMVTYIAGYSLSLGSMFWLIISEIFPLSIRGRAMGFVTAIQWLANFVVSVTFLTLLESEGTANTFWLYGAMCLIAFLFCFFLVPETTGVSLEHIERNLEKGIRTRDLGLAK